MFNHDGIKNENYVVTPITKRTMRTGDNKNTVFFF